MKLTLYKNCKLNNAYKNVFAFGKPYKYQESLIERYLLGLNKVSFDIENTYQERSGELIFPLDDIGLAHSSIYEFNYLKILSDDNTLLRYCFIDYIDLVNSVVKLGYSEDIWHSYGATMNITESFLSRNRLADVNGYYNSKIKYFPVEYQSSVSPYINEISNTTEYNIFAEIQLYETVAVFSRTTKMQTYIVKLNKVIHGSTVGDIEVINNFSFNEAQFYIKSFIMNQPIKCAWIGTNDNLYYSIEKTYIVRKNINIGSCFNEYEDSLVQYDKAIYFSGTTQQEYVSGMNFIGFLPKEECLDTINYIECGTQDPLVSNALRNDYGRLSLGTYNHQIPVIPNGDWLYYTVKLIISQYTFNLLFGVANTEIDITDDFVYECPVEQISGAEWQQKKLSSALKVVSATITMGATVGSMAQDNTSTSTQTSTRDINVKNNTTKTYANGNKTKIRNRQFGTITQTSERKTTHPKNTFSSLATIGETVVDTVGDFFPVYSTSNGVASTKDNNVSCFYGIVSVDYGMVQNYDYVLHAKDNTGWVVFEWVKNFNITGLFKDNDVDLYETHKYNFIKFECINIYGNFPRDVASDLEEILYNGTKVWFNESEIS